jgi:hypothetical protein
VPAFYFPLGRRPGHVSGRVQKSSSRPP